MTQVGVSCQAHTYKSLVMWKNILKLAKQTIDVDFSLVLACLFPFQHPRITFCANVCHVCVSHDKLCHNCDSFVPLTFFIFLENATRLCTPNGWAEIGNYAGCEDATTDSTISPENENMVELSTVIYYIGYTISLLALLLAVVVFINFKWVSYTYQHKRATLHVDIVMVLWVLSSDAW